MDDRKTAFITGISGQDGSYLAEFLLGKKYKVRGMIRRTSNPSTGRIEHLMDERYYEHDEGAPLLIEYGDMTDASSLRNVLEKVKPDEVYNLAAQSHVGISFANPISTHEINAVGTMKLLDAIRDMKLDCRYYQASSSEMFGTSPPPQNENTKFQPVSPYGASKVHAFNSTIVYRDSYDMFNSNGILFNHESNRRSINFVTRKITRELSRIVSGETNRISLGNIDAKRDWGYAKEYVEAMWSILQLPEPGDYVIATEETHTVREFLNEAFSLVELDYNDYLKIDDRFKRPAEVPALLGDASKAREVLGWKPRVKFKDLTYMMVAADLKLELERKGLVPMDLDGKNSDDFYIEEAKKILKLRNN